MGAVEHIIGSNRLKNALINGDFYHWQRGSLYTGTVNGVYLADRWKVENSQLVNMTQQISTDVPAGTNFRYSLRIQNNATATLTGVNRIAPHQPIEERVLRQLMGKRLTYSGWLKPLTFSGTVNVFVYLGATPSTRYHYKAWRVAVTANQWTRFSFDLLTNPIDNALDLSNLALGGVGGFIGIHLDGGPSVTGTTPSANSWTTVSPATVEPIRVDSGDFKFCSTLNNQILMTGFCLGEKDEFSLASEDHAQELALCQRYFERSTSGTEVSGGFSGSTSNIQTSIQFAVEKRTSPVITAYGNGVINSVRSPGGSTIGLTSPSIGSSPRGIGFINTGAANFVANTWYQFTWTAEAEF